MDHKICCFTNFFTKLFTTFIAKYGDSLKSSPTLSLNLVNHQVHHQIRQEHICFCLQKLHHEACPRLSGWAAIYSSKLLNFSSCPAPYLPWPLLNQFMVLKSETILNQACPRMVVWWSTTAAAAGPLHKGFFFSRVTSACSNNKVHEDCEFILNSQFVWNYWSWSLSSLHKKICELQCGHSPGIVDLPSCRRPLMQVQQILYQTCKGLLKPLCGWS